MEFYTKTPPIDGEIKRKMSDFLVREITLDGTMLEIKCFGAGDKKETEKEWPQNADEKKEHLILTMEKFNYDANNAVRIIARVLQVSNKRIGFAGMKDKRAITVQKISVWKPDYEKVKTFNSRYIDLRDAQWSNTRIELGDLKGNAFEITIRNISLEKMELEKTIKNCFDEMQNGIPNFFGSQRFGGIRQITHRVGKEFLKGNTENAVMLYLTGLSAQEEEEIKTARQNLARTGDFSSATHEFPVKYRFERSIIHHLCKYPKDFAGAFRKLPKNLVYMFVHAYQSHLFNRIIVERIKQGFGVAEIKGDVLEDGVPTVPLFGFNSEFSGGKSGEIEKKILKDEGIELSEFKVKEMPELSSKGSRKKMVLHPKNLKLAKTGPDEMYEGRLKAVISFELNKGNYATTVLCELLKKEIL
ncbi:MAG: tRNA pseudouridine(13) synthase TruD [archaeon]